jgi:membrane protein required for colicin V production
MNLLDYALALILGYCFVRGVFRGLVKEITSIVGVLGGFYFAYGYYPRIAHILRHWIANAGFANILAFLILFVGVYLVINIAGVAIKYLMNIVFLGWTDRIGGALFGAAKGALIVAVVVAMLTTFLPRDTALLRDSLLARHAMGVSAVLVRMVSADTKKLFDDHLKELRQTWQRINK